MRVDVDWDRCEGHGQCEWAAPDLFGLDDDGELRYAYDGLEVPEDRAAEARSAIAACPVAAMREGR